jgi:NADPH:quinone reductase-like Zn-dependent oxidoreductase
MAQVMGVPEPKAGPGQVAVRIKAVGVNPISNLLQSHAPLPLSYSSVQPRLAGATSRR